MQNNKHLLKRNITLNYKHMKELRNISSKKKDDLLQHSGFP